MDNGNYKAAISHQGTSKFRKIISLSLLESDISHIFFHCRDKTCREKIYETDAILRPKLCIFAYNIPFHQLNGIINYY